VKIDDIYNQVKNLPKSESTLGSEDIYKFSSFFKLKLSDDLLKYQETNFCKFMIYDSLYGSRFGDLRTHNIDMYTLDSKLICIIVSYPANDLFDIYWVNDVVCFQLYDYLKTFEVYYIQRDIDYLNPLWDINVNISFDPEANENVFKDIIEVHSLNDIPKKIRKDWTEISSYEYLSESFIIEYEPFLNWIAISQHQKLSEEFIEKYQHKVDWANISEYQKLSENFIVKFRHKIASDYLYLNDNLTEKFVDDALALCRSLKVDRKQINFL
jgi:hypothetical protein